MNYLYLFLMLFTLTNHAQLLSDSLENASIHQPAAQKLLRAANSPNLEQYAKPRLKRERPSDPLSPGQCNLGIRKEREALEAFYIYMKDHIDHAENAGLTPLNPATVLRAAIHKILVGEGLFYEKLAFFTPLHQENSHAVLQVALDLDLTDSESRTNRDRMKLGKSPLGPDGKRMNLHHVAQRDGFLMELSKTTHNRWHRYLHHDLTPGKSHIDRSDFNKVRSDYWKWRIQQIENEEAEVRRKLSFVAIKNAIPPKTSIQPTNRRKLVAHHKRKI